MSSGDTARSPPKLGGVARRAEGVCQAATGLGDAAPTQGLHTPQSLRASSSTELRRCYFFATFFSISKRIYRF